MTVRYFEIVKKRIARLEWLIERQSIDTEYDEDADVGVISGNITFKDGSVFHFKDVLLGKSRQYRFHYMDERSNLICRWDTAAHQIIFFLIHSLKKTSLNRISFPSTSMMLFFLSKVIDFCIDPGVLRSFSVIKSFENICVF